MSIETVKTVAHVILMVPYLLGTLSLIGMLTCPNVPKPNGCSKVRQELEQAFAARK